MNESPKNIVRLCPMMSTAITFERVDAQGARTRMHDLARSPCIRGECMLFDVKTFSCGLVKP